MVGETRFELVWGFPHRFLRPICKPIPTLAHVQAIYAYPKYRKFLCTQQYYELYFRVIKGCYPVFSRFFGKVIGKTIKTTGVSGGA